MIQYKTICVPEQPFKLTKREYRSGLLGTDKANAAVEPLRKAIEAEAKGGWVLHSIQVLPQRMIRKKSILELLLGWIPILGGWLFPTMKTDCHFGTQWHLYILTFVKES